VAVFKAQRGSVSVEINNVDHGRPHCHVSGLPRRLSVKVDLFTLEVTKPKGRRLPPQVRRFLAELQQAMLKAWDDVIRVDRSDDDDADD
jgi:hypothetical protein